MRHLKKGLEELGDAIKEAELRRLRERQGRRSIRQGNTSPFRAMTPTA